MSLVFLPVTKGQQKWNFLGKMNEEIPMKKSRFTEALIMGVLRQAEGGPAVPELCRAHGISSAMFYIYGRLSLCKRFEAIIERGGC